MRIDLLGAEFNIKTDENPEYLEEVVELFRSKVDELRGSVGTSDPLKIAILAGILIADDYLKLTGSQRATAAEAAKITVGLITELETALDEEADRLSTESTTHEDPDSYDNQSV
jgi:cell division protein ZapA (FtsZ GTPase activity inhibitor)